MKTLNRYLNELAPIGKIERVIATDSTIKQLVREGIESDTKQKQVEALPLGESVKPETHQSLANV